MLNLTCCLFITMHFAGDTFLSQHRTSKKPVSKFRKVVPGLMAPSRDPRFDDLSGSFNEDSFRKSYSFIDEQRGTELKAALAELKKTKDEDRREQLTKLVQRMREQSNAQKTKDSRRAAKSKRLKAERELVKGGKKPFYLKKSDEKTLELVEQYTKAKQDGSLEKKLRTKRKRTSSKVSTAAAPEHALMLVDFSDRSQGLHSSCFFL